jgi:hypothetical protein
MTDPNIVPLKKETLLAMIRNAPDTRLFRSLFVQYQDSGKIKDVTNDGEYSCAFFVSGLLTLAGYLPRPHGTVKGLRYKLGELSYSEVPPEERQAGDIIFWEKMKFPDGSENEHVGFVLDHDRAISTSYKKQCVVEHPINMPGAVVDEPRKITLVIRME